MKSSVVLTVSVFAGLAATAMALVPLAASVQEAERIVALGQPANAADPARAESGPANSAAAGCAIELPEGLRTPSRF